MEWAKTTAGLHGPANGRYRHGEDNVYIVSSPPGGKVTVSRISAENWAAGHVQGIVADIAQSITEVADCEEGQRVADMYEAGLDDPGRPAWQHVP